MATNIPPHNLKEIGEAICAAIDIGPDHFQAKDVYKHIKGPDFPTGGIILGDEGILNAIETGRGSIVLRSKTEIIKEGAGKNKDSIIITEIPYQVNKASLIEKIADLVNNGVIPEIADIRDESDRKGLQIYIALKKNSDPNACLNRLFVKTKLQIKFSINSLALFKNGLQPKILTYAEILREFITHRVIVIRKRTVYNLKKAENRLHINEGLLIAINNIDAVVELIKQSENPQEAHQKLIQEFSLSDLQAEAILKMPLSRLTNLQTQKLVTEKQDLLSNITEYKAILADKQKIYGIIKKETRDLMDKYGDARRTEIRENAPNVNLTYEKTIPEEESVIILTENQIIKRMALSHYQSQRRGGKGKRGIKIREEDLIQQMFITSSHDIILLFTQQGRVYSISAYEIPLGSRYSQGKALINYIALKSEEIIDITAISDFQDAKSLIFVTKKGFIKKTELKEFLNITRNGIICMNLHEGDELVRVQLCDPQYHIFIPTKNGYAIHFEESELRPIGRTAMGVRGLQLRQKNDEVVDLVISKPNARIITITKMGHGKISELNLYRLIHRAGKGVRNIRLSIKNDEVIASKAVKYNEDLLVASSKGILIRIPTKDIRDTGRSTQGVRLMRLDEDDEIRSVALCESDENED
jgi:DNA gyrase subunit A